MKISLSAEVPGTPEEVFPWLDDPQKAMLWQRSVKRAEILRETPGRTGTTFVEEMEEGGDTLQMHGTITAYAKDELIAFHLESRIHQVDASYRLRPEGGHSALTVESSIHWKFPMNLLTIILGRRIKAGILAQTQAELGELSRLCEAEQRGRVDSAESMLPPAG